MVFIIEKERTLVMNAEGGIKQVLNIADFDMLLEDNNIENEKNQLFSMENAQ